MSQSDVRLIHGDCLEYMRGMVSGSIDAVITDPPYPDYHADKYAQTPIEFLRGLHVRQLVFWSAKVEFPLDYTAVHIWDKKVGAGSQYERIFERNGNNNYNVYRYYLINSTVAASFTRDEFTGHPSQKPLQLMRHLIREFTKTGDTVIDPFMGSGSTGVACIQMGRKFIGIEIDQGYFALASRRIAAAQAQLRLEMEV